MITVDLLVAPLDFNVNEHSQVPGIAQQFAVSSHKRQLKTWRKIISMCVPILSPCHEGSGSKTSKTYYKNVGFHLKCSKS